jgi:starch synthase
MISANKKMKILIVSVEVSPFAKVGGLADVAGALPKALAKLGHDVRVLMPAYKMIEDNPKYKVKPLIDKLPVPINPHWIEEGFVKQTTISGDIPVYLVGSKRFFSKANESVKVYDIEAGADPYIFLDRAVPTFIEAFKKEWMPDVIHCNDWHTGLIPVYLEHLKLDNIGTVFTIHNLAYQGSFDKSLLPNAGLPESYFNMFQMEAYGRVNFLKSGLVFAHMANTVSPNYAKEIQTEEYGAGLQGLLKDLADHGNLRGILNGIDYDEFDPNSDPNIPFQYSAGKIAGKAKCKLALQQEFGLPQDENIPVIGLVSRLADQKGLDLIKEVVAKVLGLPTQFVVLGLGDKTYESYFKSLQKKYPNHMRANICFDADLASRIYAGSDLFLMPSRFEPCGLGQMISLRYGTIPIVRKTGGLTDTVIEFDPIAHIGNGFVFEEYKAAALLETIQRGVKTFQNKEKWNELVERALKSDFSWKFSALEYIDLYEAAVAKAKEGQQTMQASLMNKGLKVECCQS